MAHMGGCTWKHGGIQSSIVTGKSRPDAGLLGIRGGLSTKVELGGMNTGVLGDTKGSCHVKQT